MSFEHFVLIKPLIHPKAYVDEEIKSYLQRIAKLNHCGSFRWLICAGEDQKKRFPSMEQLYGLLVENSDWTGFNATASITQEVSLLPANLRGNLTHLRYCPLCLQEAEYYRTQWFLRLSTSCLRHQVLLKDRCIKCARPVKTQGSEMGHCQCKAELALHHEVDIACDGLLAIQYFIEKGTLPERLDQCLNPFKQDEFSTLQGRIAFLDFMARWIPERLKARYVEGCDSNLNELSSAIKICAQLYKIVFSEKKSFLHYLSELQTLPKECTLNGVDSFTRFYRTFYRRYSEYSMIGFKRMIEEYIRQHWQKPISNKNSLFTSKLREDYPWIPLRQVCLDYQLDPSVVKKAAKEGVVSMQEAHKNKRTFRLYYRPSIEEALDSLQSEMTFDEVLVILGVTKKQLYKMLDQGLFPEAIVKKRLSTDRWRFDQDDIYNYLHRLFMKVQSTHEKAVSIPDALRIIGNRVSNALVKLLMAIENNEMRITTVSIKDIGIRGIGLIDSDFNGWLHRALIPEHSHLSIVQIAKRFGVNQEFAYQLVNFGLLSYEQIGNTRWITTENIRSFHQNYELLTHYSKSQGLGSRYIANQLDKMGIFPVDHEWHQKLRQKVYLKSDLFEKNHDRTFNE